MVQRPLGTGDSGINHQRSRLLLEPVLAIRNPRAAVIVTVCQPQIPSTASPEENPPLDFQPLRFPTPWPPPDGRPKDVFDGIPILGGLLRAISGLFVESEYWRINYDVESQIIDQLESRPLHSPDWVSDPVQQEVLKSLASAVCQEKGLSSATLHPDDPVISLFWGPYDDLSPFLFRQEIAARLKCRLPKGIWPNVLLDCPEGPLTHELTMQSKVTVRTFIERVAHAIALIKSGQLKSR